MKRRRNNVGGGAARVLLHSRLSLEGAVTSAPTGSPELKLAVTHLIGPPEQLPSFSSSSAKHETPQHAANKRSKFRNALIITEKMGGEWEAGEDAAFLARPCASASEALRPVCYERLGSTLDLTHEPAAPRSSMTDLNRKSVGKGWSSTELRAQGVCWKGEGCSEKHQRASKYWKKEKS